MILFSLSCKFFCQSSQHFFFFFLSLVTVSLKCYLLERYTPRITFSHAWCDITWYAWVRVLDGLKFYLKSAPDLFQCTIYSLVVHGWPLRGTAAHQIIAPVYFRLCILTVHQPTHQANIQILLHYFENDSPNSLSVCVSSSLPLSLSVFRWGTLKKYMLIKIGD